MLEFSGVDNLDDTGSQTLSMANMESGIQSTMGATTTANTVEYHISPPSDLALNSSMTNSNIAIQINDDKRPLNAYGSHDANETDCFGTVINIIGSLHVRKPTCCLHQPSGTSHIPSVDVVLAQNKQVCVKQTMNRLSCNIIEVQASSG